MKPLLGPRTKALDDVRTPDGEHSVRLAGALACQRLRVLPRDLSRSQIQIRFLSVPAMSLQLSEVKMRDSTLPG
jgi:hypothetical protein